jgi:hypothetical protein
MATLGAVISRLGREKPWFDALANQGSLTNAELLYEQLGKHNWGEVVMGYCATVEEELKTFLYKEYLAFFAQKYEKGYDEQSHRQTEPSGVLHFIGNVSRDAGRQQLWHAFVKARFPEHHDFLSTELPRLCDSLAHPSLRGKSAHGKMQDRAKAEEARSIVLGTGGKPGLLERLVGLRQSGRDAEGN